MRSAKKLAAARVELEGEHLHRLGAGHAADDGAELRPRLRDPALAVGERAALGERRVEPAVADVAEQRLQPGAGAQPRPARGDPLAPRARSAPATSSTRRPASASPARARPSRDRHLGRARRRVRGVRDVVADGDVVRVPDRGDHRLGAREERAAQALVVERDEVLHRAAPARDDDHVDERVLLHAGERVDQVARRGGALDERAARDDVDRREAVDERADHVAHPVRRPAGDDTDRAREARQRLAARRVGQALGGQALEQLGPAAQQLALAGQPHAGDDDADAARRA